MNMTQRYDNFYRLTSDAQAAATLCLADVIQGTTHSVDLTFNQERNLSIDATVSGEPRYPIQVEQR